MWQTILDRLAESFSVERIADSTAAIIPDVVLAAITALGFWVVWRFLRRTIGAVMARTGLDATAQGFAETVLRYTVATIGIVAVLGQMGINTGSVLASLGVLGLTIGFAAQDALSNLISGIFIFWDRPFVIGDLVEIDGKYGTVQAITMRSTRVVTVDGKMLAIPNREVVNSTVTSYTNFPHLRIDIPVTIGVEESIPKVRALLLDIIAGDDRFMDSPAPTVVVSALNDYNIEMVLRVWITDEREHVGVRFELREAVFNTLNTAGVEMPFEHLTIGMH